MSDIGLDLAGGGLASEIDTLAERYLAQPQAADLLKWARAAFRDDPIAFARVLPRLISPELPYTTANGLKRLLTQLRSIVTLNESLMRIAILGGSNTRPLAELLELYLHAGGIRAEIYEFDYGTFRQELLDPTSGLHRFDAEFVLILPTWRDIERRPMPGNTRETIDAKIADEVAAWSNYWSAALPAGTQIIQDNFIPPPFRPLGNLDGVHDVGFSRFIRRLNDALIDAAPPSVTIHDADLLAQAHGRWKWSDERSFYDVKLSCAPTMLPYYANSLASQLLMQRGRSKKCLALDLDNTLWGGVIGDDGLEGIQIGQGDPRSEAFASLQAYIKSLKERGVILAVCSKNTESIAREAFENHPEMICGSMTFHAL